MQGGQFATHSMHKLDKNKKTKGQTKEKVHIDS